MITYHKIQSLFKRDDKGLIVPGAYSLPEFEYLKDCQWQFTEKIDGTNIRISFDHHWEHPLIAGKSEKSQMPVKLHDALRKLFYPKLNLFKEVFPEPADGTASPQVCLYGEGYGGVIQKGKNYRSDEGFILFDVWINGWWLKRSDVEKVAMQLGIDYVNVFGSGTLEDLVKEVRQGFVSGISINRAYGAEGIVARPMVELKSRNGDRIITKLKTNDFRKLEAHAKS